MSMQVGRARRSKRTFVDAHLVVGHGRFVPRTEEGAKQPQTRAVTSALGASAFADATPPLVLSPKKVPRGEHKKKADPEIMDVFEFRACAARRGSRPLVHHPAQTASPPLRNARPAGIQQPSSAPLPSPAPSTWSAVSHNGDSSTPLFSPDLAPFRRYLRQTIISWPGRTFASVICFRDRPDPRLRWLAARPSPTRAADQLRLADIPISLMPPPTTLALPKAEARKRVREARTRYVQTRTP
jgi:hypothetical protein